MELIIKNSLAASSTAITASYAYKSSVKGNVYVFRHNNSP